MIHTLQSQIVFLRKFFQSPRQIGAIAPSSPSLARQIVHLAGARHCKSIIEFGPGTGVFTKEIIARMPCDAKLLSVEADAKLAILLRKKYHRARIAAGYAQHIQRIMAAYRFPRADCIVSGLPWASFEAQLQDDILLKASAVLKPGGRFTTFGYLHALCLPNARRFRNKLYGTFASVHISKIIWNNIPPSIVYCCTKAS